MERHEKRYPLDEGEIARALDVLKGLADETRLRIVFLLTEGELSVGKLVAALELPQSTVSRHLSLLRCTKLVSTRRNGTTVFYRLENAHLGHIVLETLSFAEHERLGLPDHARAKVKPAHGRRKKGTIA